MSKTAKSWSSLGRSALGGLGRNSRCHLAWGLSASAAVMGEAAKAREGMPAEAAATSSAPCKISLRQGNGPLERLSFGKGRSQLVVY